MRAPAPTPRPKYCTYNLIVVLGLFFGILITAAIWLNIPNRIIAPLSGLAFGLIGLGSFLCLRQTVLSRPRWITLLSALAAVSLVYLFPELFRPVCGGIPRAFALDCPAECRIQVCVKWVPGPSPKCPKPGPGGGCCLKYDTTCDPDCEPLPPPPPPDLPPQITASLFCNQSGLDAWCIGSLSLDLLATEPQGKDVLVSGDVDGIPFACPIGTGAASCSLPLPEGTGIVNYLATSTTGLTASGSVAYKHDSQLPLINGWLSGTGGNNGWFISAVDINASASDPVPGSGIATFDQNLNGAGWQNFSEPLSFSDGEHSLSLRASDNAGNVVNTDQIVQVDTVTPALNLSISGTMGLNGWYSSPVQVNATASDSGSGVSTFEFDLDRAGWAAYSAPVELADGIHSLALRVIDSAGNLTEGTKSFQIDTLAPAIELSITGTEGSGDWYKSAVQIEASASDAGSGLSTLEVRLDGGAWSAYTSDIVFDDGLHTCQFRARDKAGNLSETAVQQFKVDTVLPSVELPESWSLGQTVPFELKDYGSGLAYVRLVIEDESDRHPKVTWDESLESYKFKGKINWDGRFKDGGPAQPGGEYYAWLKVSDHAGNESTSASQITVAENTPPTDDQTGGLIDATEISKPIAPIEFPPANPEAEPELQSQPPVNIPEVSFGGGENDAAEASIAQPAGIDFNIGGSSNSPVDNSQSNILWGATATAALGAFVAEIARRKEAEKAAKRAANAARNQARKLKEAAYAISQKLKKQEAALKETRQQLVADARTGQKEEIVEQVMQSYGQKPQELGDSYDRYMEQKAYEAYRAGEVTVQTALPAALCTPENIQKPETWWEQTLNWIDNHQKVASVGIGIGMGILTAGLVLAVAATAVVTLPVLLVAAGAAAVAAGAEVAIGTALLNKHFGRDLTSNVWSNIGAATVSAAITTGIGLFVMGGGLTGTLITLGNGAAALCANHPTLCAYSEPVLKGIDLLEETGLMIKGTVQTWKGDSVGAAETMLDLQMEYLDGGVPGNAIAKELGEEVGEWATLYGDDVVDLVQLYGDDVFDLIRLYKEDAINIIGAYGDDGIALLYRFEDNADEAIALVKEFGTPAVKVLNTVDLRSAQSLLTTLDSDMLDYAIDQGPSALKALSYWPDDFIRKYGDELVLRAPYDAKVLEAASKFANLENLTTQEARDLLDTIAYNSIQNSGNRIVLGKWVNGTLDEGFIGVARADGALFYGTNPGLDEIFEKSGKYKPEDLYWSVNNRVIEIATEQDIKIDYSLSGLPREEIPIEINAMNALQSGMSIDDVAEKFFKGNIPFRMKEIEVLVDHGYSFTVDASNNLIHWSKP